MKLTPASLPDNLIRRMNPKARKELGVMSLEEANERYIAKNERELQNQIANLLRLRSIWYCQSRCDKPTRTAVGAPDFLFCLSGIPMAFEVKFEKGKLTDDQIRTHAQMAQNGWRVHVVRTVSEAKSILDSIL